MMMNRRTLLLSTVAAVTGGAFALSRGAAAEKFEFELTEAEWRKGLSPRAYAVLREADTERPFSSPLNDEKRDGVFACAGCDLPLYDSKAKYDSGTGWPSFYEALPDAVRTKTDYILILPRTELHCRRCGGHLGHRFDDGPPPTGKRHCINGVSLAFQPRKTG
jgi:peptide-methionine (R)-S-oxide reductase